MNSPISIRGQITQVNGHGYFYRVKKTAHDVTAKLKIARETMNDFVRRCGHVNTVGLRGITVAEQGGGWYEIFTVNDFLSPAVLHFLQRLNRWACRMVYPQCHEKKNKYHYFVEARAFHHPSIRRPIVRERYQEMPYQAATASSQVAATA